MDAERDRLIQEYKDQFNDNFPLLGFSGTDKDLIKALKECLGTGIPYELKDADNRSIDLA